MGEGIFAPPPMRNCYSEMPRGIELRVGREGGSFIVMHRYDLAKTLIISVEMLIRYRVIGRDCYNYELLMALDRILRYTVSLMTSAEKGQPPPNDPKELQDNHSVASYSLRHLARFTLHFDFKCCTFHVPLYTFPFPHSNLHILLYKLYFTRWTSHCTLLIALLHIKLCMLHFAR